MEQIESYIIQHLYEYINDIRAMVFLIEQEEKRRLTNEKEKKKKEWVGD